MGVENTQFPKHSTQISTQFQGHTKRQVTDRYKSAVTYADICTWGIYKGEDGQCYHGRSYSRNWSSTKCCRSMFAHWEGSQGTSWFSKMFVVVRWFLFTLNSEIGSEISTQHTNAHLQMTCRSGDYLPSDEVLGGCFQTFFMFTHAWAKFPFWQLSCKRVGKTTIWNTVFARWSSYTFGTFQSANVQLLGYP